MPSESGNTAASAPAPDWFARGSVLRNGGDPKAALECFRRAVEIRHDNVEALVSQGEVQFELCLYEDAADSFELALAFEPDCIEALLGLGRLAREAGDQERALRHLQRAVQRAPHNPELRFELGLSYNRAGDTQAALSSYTRALELQPQHAAACVNLGLIYLAQRGDARRAQQLFERAAAMQPESVAAQANLGLALQEQGQFDAAFAHYQRLIDAYPDVVEYRWNRGLALLSRGDFANGWNDYELRNSRVGKAGARRFSFQAWDGSPLTARQVLVYGEQGIGDEIMFASCLPDVLRQSRSVVVACDVRLEPLFRRSFPAAHVHGAPRGDKRDWLSEFPKLDTQVAAGSLPRFLRRQWSDFPQHSGYLVADPARVAYWKSRLAPLGGRFKAGLCWRGGTRKTRRETRSLAVEQCLPLLAASSCRFICLQNGECGDELEILRRQGVELQWWPEATNDFDELAALITALDLVISVDNTVAHLSGALGKPLWVMLSASPEWRYLWQGERMPWYPSASLFRQSEPGQWDSVVRGLRQSLDRMNQRRG